MLLIESQAEDIDKYFNRNNVNEYTKNEEVIHAISVNEIEEKEEDDVQGKI